MNKADAVFLRPMPLYTWDAIVSGTTVCSEPGANRRMTAVGGNTFRGFYRLDKTSPGPKEAFISYFVTERQALVEALYGVRTREELHHLSNRICAAIRARLTNCAPRQLVPYNKIRKPVDLYLEHLTAMAVELDAARSTLVPLLYLPLDSQILAHTALFTDAELKAHGLHRNSTYKDITTENIYLALQHLLGERAEAVAAALHRPFPVIYFDLLWNDRYRNWGANLFETNP